MNCLYLLREIHVCFGKDPCFFFNVLIQFSSEESHFPMFIQVVFVGERDTYIWIHIFRKEHKRTVIFISFARSM